MTGLWLRDALVEGDVDEFAARVPQAHVLQGAANRFKRHAPFRADLDPIGALLHVAKFAAFHPPSDERGAACADLGESFG